MLQITLAYESIVLCMCSGKYNGIYFYMKITYFQIHFLVYKALFTLASRARWANAVPKTRSNTHKVGRRVAGTNDYLVTQLQKREEI